MTWREQDHPRDEKGQFTFKEKLRQEEITLHKNDNKKAPAYTDAEISALEKQNIDTKDIKPKKKPFIIMQLFSESTKHKKYYPKELSIEEQKEFVKKLRNLEPIPLNINGEIIYAKYDKRGAEKYLHGDGVSTENGYHKIKVKLIDEVIDAIKTSKYHKTKPETHEKNNSLHNKTKNWHYFRNNITSKRQRYRLIINVRESNKGLYYFYEIKVTDKK